MTDKTELPKLLPCPFCGGAANVERRAPGGTMSSGMEPYMQRIACAKCGIGLPWEHPKQEWGKQHKHDAQLTISLIGRWNTRAPGAVAEGLSAEQVGGWCNVLTHAHMYVTERSHANAQTGIKAVLDDLRKLQARLAAPAPAESKPAEPVVDEATVSRLAKALCDKLQLIHNDYRYQGVWAIAHAHGIQYSGPAYADELAALTAALRGEGE